MKNSRSRRAVASRLLLLTLAAQGAASAASAVPSPASALSRLSLEELANIEISSVSKRTERLADAPAAAYVITREDIRRFGATSLAEALRLAPNLQVARSNANTYAISARGFNATGANKLLVLIDGRTVYTPLTAGVFWDMQDVMLEDIERIEVVSGPGGTLWGTNAVNGVINILTRPAAETPGTLLSAAAGTDDRGAALRHGWRIGPETSARLYAKRTDYDATSTARGSDVVDAWHLQQAGLRLDHRDDGSSWTLQGDAYDGKSDVAGGERTVAGANLLARWNRALGPDAGLQLQAYYDRVQRHQLAGLGTFNLDLDTVDVDVQHHLAWGAMHDIVWGAGYRSMEHRTAGNPLLQFQPAERKLSLVNVFAQDTLRIAERIKLTLGVKAERNSFTGVELQPTLRLAWKPSDERLVWAALSRAVRTPSPVDRDFVVLVNLNIADPSSPYNGRLLGGPDFVAERVNAYELGYRTQPTANLSYSASAFYNDYTRLRSIERRASGDFVLGNQIAAHTYGIELWGRLRVNERWQLSAGYNRLVERFRFEAGSTDPGQAAAGANDPRYQASLRSQHDLPRDVSLDIGLRAVGALPNPAVPRHVALDLRLAWAVSPGLELSLAGFNLLDAQHPEFGSARSRSEIGRSANLRLVWKL
ncbi:TonB-dependent receptor plug domain-containing protein [Aquabacterium sp.]|uniref:TonB-dependent receptor plug domain-containing protein n=1 Tax=Aquabacterium sp. TaxID=1872578 RepID=UPI002C76EAED|nr:TonB-dependent receptor [Aquabacterium sp.]HSW06795.1 TonB-dependent receptor [Aquabacterium sp.]